MYECVNVSVYVTVNVYVTVSCTSTNIEQTYHKQPKGPYLYSTTRWWRGGHITQNNTPKSQHNSKMSTEKNESFLIRI